MSTVIARSSQVTICNIGFRFVSVTTIPTGGDGCGASSSEARRRADDSIVANLPSPSRRPPRSREKRDLGIETVDERRPV